MLNKVWNKFSLGALVVALAFAIAACQGSPVKQVAALDQDAILQLEAFKKADEEIKKMIEAKEKEVEKKVKEAKTNDEKRNIIEQAQIDMQKATNEKLLPLKTRAEAAVAAMAREKGAIVVLDKRIVVYGVPDITEEVKKKFEAEGELTLPEEQDTSTAPIGYFDQDVVRSLKVFQEAEVMIFQKRAELAQQLQKTVEEEKPSPSELQGMQKELTLRLEAYNEQLMTPLIQAVNDSVEEVAKAEGLSLVLDKQHVMYGGRNMTSEVVETFLKKAGAPGEETPAPAATPKATPTPEAE